MNDSDSDPGIDLTGFLFGNVDESGQLENDVLDSESKRHLASLGRLGLNSFWDEFIPRKEVKKYKSDSDSDDDGVLQERDHTGDVQNQMDYAADKDGNSVQFLICGCEVTQHSSEGTSDHAHSSS